MYHNIAIDSLTIMTPISEFRYINVSLFDEIGEVNLETGELLNVGQKPIYYKEFGITLRAFISNLFGKHYLNITVSSKVMQKDYLHGITNQSFRGIFQFLVSKFNFDIDYYQYIYKSIVIDCDFKADFYKDDKEFHELCKFYSVFPSAKVYYTSKQHFLDEKVISGLQYVNRNDASIRSPFVKFYSKEHELLGKSIEFFENFLTPIKAKLKYLRRVEVTIKNKQHFESFNCCKTHSKAIQSQINSLHSILTLSSDNILDIIFQCINRYSSVRPDEIKVVEEVKNVPYSATDHLVVRSFDILMTESKFTLNQCLSLLDDYPGLNPNTKSRIRKRIKDAFKEYQKIQGVRTLVVDTKDAFFEP